MAKVATLEDMGKCTRKNMNTSQHCFNTKHEFSLISLHIILQDECDNTVSEVLLIELPNFPLTFTGMLYTYENTCGLVAILQSGVVCIFIHPIAPNIDIL